MTPAAAIAMLDTQLARHGETIVIKRGGASVTCRAMVRGRKADQIVGTITQTEIEVILSPTGFSSFGLIRANDVAVIKGKERKVMFSDPIYLAGTLVRTNLVVAG